MSLAILFTLFGSSSVAADCGKGQYILTPYTQDNGKTTVSLASVPAYKGNLQKLWIANLVNCDQRPPGGNTFRYLMQTWPDDYPVIVDRLLGFAFILSVDDKDKDGTQDLVVDYHAGAHAERLNLYSITDTGLVKFSGAALSSSFDDIAFGTNSEGKPIITTKSGIPNAAGTKVIMTTKTYRLEDGNIRLISSTKHEVPWN